MLLMCQPTIAHGRDRQSEWQSAVVHDYIDERGALDVIGMQVLVHKSTARLCTHTKKKN